MADEKREPRVDEQRPEQVIDPEPRGGEGAGLLPDIPPSVRTVRAMRNRRRVIE